MTDKKIILVIDDDQNMREMLSTVLGALGFEVHCRHDGNAAVHFAEEWCFPIVITDYRMPGLNGIEVTRQLRVRCPGVFIIGASAEDKEQDFARAGADAFLKKPFHIPELISLIGKAHAPERRDRG
jgi:CheY-like chemotaxis protein